MLSHAQIKTAAPSNKPYKLFDNGGLFLLVQPTGHRGWRFKYRIGGHEKLISPGPDPIVSLAKARLKLRCAKALLLDGIDPSLKRKAEKHAGADSFEAVAREWYGSHECRWADSYSDHIIRRFERDIFPWLGNKPIKKISPCRRNGPRDPRSQRILKRVAPAHQRKALRDADVAKDSIALSKAALPIGSACRFFGYSERTNSARSSSINTHRRPIFAPGMTPRFARIRTSSGCMCRNAAAAFRSSVFMTSSSVELFGLLPSLDTAS